MHGASSGGPAQNLQEIGRTAQRTAEPLPGMRFYLAAVRPSGLQQPDAGQRRDGSGLRLNPRAQKQVQRQEAAGKPGSRTRQKASNPEAAEDVELVTSTSKSPHGP